jgi:hypothetical protein
MTEEEIKGFLEETEKQKKEGFKRWGWFGVIEKLANGDITKFEEVTNQNFILSLNLLSYWKERDAIEREMIKEATKI